MRRLQDVITALRKQVEAGLRHGGQLQSGKIMATFEVVVSENAEGEVDFQVLTESDGKSVKGKTPDRAGHSVTIEFEIGQRFANSTATGEKPVSISEPAQPSALGDQELERRLALLFGAPGFDSSARATVFREVMEDIIADGRFELFHESLSSGSVVTTPLLKSYWQRLQRVLNSGPTKDSAQSLPLLLSALNSRPIGTLLAFIKGRWKEQLDWTQDSA